MSRRINNKSISRLEAYCHGPKYSRSKKILTGYSEGIESSVKSVKNTIDTLLKRHLDYCKIEEYIAENPVLTQYHSMAYNECSRNKEYSMVSVMINTLAKIAEVLIEHEKGYEHMSQSELVKRINELEAENEEFRSTLDKLGDIYDVIGKCRRSSSIQDDK